MIILFFSGVLLLVIVISIICIKCNETQQLRALKWGGVLLLMIFMINSESYRISQGDKIEELQIQVIEQSEQIEIIRNQLAQTRVIKNLLTDSDFGVTNVNRK